MNAEQFLRDKGIIIGDKKQFVINYPDGTSFSFNDFLEEYAEQFKPKWISVDDELPRQGNNVIMCYRFGVGEAKFINGNFCMLHDWETIFPVVTHWMPLPEKPE